MTLLQRVEQFKAGLISRKELQKFIDFENMGSDYTFYSFNDQYKQLVRN